MMIYRKERLNNVSPILKCLALIALSKLKGDYIIVEGLRTKERQLELYGKGRTIAECQNVMSLYAAKKYAKPDMDQVTWTLKSNHLTGCAIDVIPFYKWEKDPELIRCMVSHGFESGSFWKKADIPHFQIVLPKPKRKSIDAANTTEQLTVIIQAALKKAGYYITVDGLFGEKTKKAVISYKKDHGLLGTGRVTRKMLKMLLK